MHRLRLSVIYILLPALVAGILTGCSNTQYLTGDQVLLKKNEVTIETGINYKKIRKNIEENLSLEGKLASLAKQQPNKKTLGLFKLNLTIYNRYYTTDTKGIYHWIMTTIGEPPMLFDSTSLPASADIMHEYMVSKGYLLPKITYDFRIKKKLATPHFYVVPGPLYTIDSITFEKDTTEVSKILDTVKQNSLLRAGDAFDADVMGNEQLRIFREYQNRGYFHFLRDYIYFEADTSNTLRTVDVDVKIQKPPDEEGLRKYYIDKIFVFPNYNAEQALEVMHHDTVKYNSEYFVDGSAIVKPEVLNDAIFIESGKPYSRKDYEYTLTRLADLGLFKFISIRFEEKPDHHLDCLVFLTPAKKHAITTEVEASNIEDNVGAAVRVQYRNKNLFREANQFDAGVNGGIQIPVLNKDSLIFNLTGQINFYLPRFVFPVSKKLSRYLNPRTKISLQANYYQQTKIYILKNYTFTYGYEWRKSAFKRSILNLFSFSYVNSNILSNEFQQRLNTDPFLRQSFEDQLISGLNYTYIFSNQLPEKRTNFTFFRFSGEVAGTSIYLLNRAITNSNLDSSGRYRLFGTNYANFVRAEIDIRRYFPFSQNRTIVFRFAAGEAINYWNSFAVPYIKQFYLGGTSSMRAWRVRSLGPGSFKDTTATSFFSSAGDIKLEGNVEYRFSIFGRLRGAIFVDAGNIWLRKKDPNKPGAEFQLDRFTNEIAIGTGLGFRFDFTYFILRLDVATPLRDPSSPVNNRWVIKNLDLSSGDWRKQNLLFNLAIGYPF